MANTHTPDGSGGQLEPDLAAGVILYRRAADGLPRFLLLETRKGGHYSPPKGHLDPGEGFEAAARRETLEECGLEVATLDPAFRVEIGYEVNKRGRQRRKRVVYFLGEAVPGDVRLSDEHLSARWEPLEALPDLLPFENLVRVFVLAGQKLAARNSTSQVERSLGNGG